ncbi:MAG: methionine--tRNA ligase, partial [Pseudomonadota bacterium]
NFVSRVTKFCRSKFGERVPEGGYYEVPEQKVVADIARRIDALEAHWEAIEIRKAAAELRGIWAVGNEYLQETAPWAVIKTDEDRAATIIRFALNLMRIYGILSRPFIPDASDRILEALCVPDDGNDWPEDRIRSFNVLEVGHEFSVPANLFDKITDEAREEMAGRFSGT